MCSAGSSPCCADSRLALCSSCSPSGLSLVTLHPGVPPSTTSLWFSVRQGADHQSDPFCPSFLPFSTASHSKTNEDLKQENSELQEKLRVLVTDKEAAQLRVEELRKKLEMSELLLQQVRGWPGSPGPPAGAGISVVPEGDPSQELGNGDPGSGPAIESSRF